MNGATTQLWSDSMFPYVLLKVFVEVWKSTVSSISFSLLILPLPPLMTAAMFWILQVFPTLELSLWCRAKCLLLSRRDIREVQKNLLLVSLFYYSSLCHS